MKLSDSRITLHRTISVYETIEYRNDELDKLEDSRLLDIKCSLLSLSIIRMK